jgi:hypothetical protein
MSSEKTINCASDTFTHFLGHRKNSQKKDDKMGETCGAREGKSLRRKLPERKHGYFEILAQI